MAMAEGRQSEIRRSSEYANELQGSVSFLSLGEEDEQSLEPHQYPQCSTPPHTTQVGVGTSAVTQQRLQLQSQSMPRTKVGTMPSGKQSQEIPASCDDSSRNEHQRKPRTDSRKLVRPQTAPSSKTFRKPERPADSDDELASLLERTRIKDDEGPEQLAIGAKGSTTSTRILRGPDGKPIFVWDKGPFRHVQGMPTWMKPDDLDELSEMELSSDL